MSKSNLLHSWWSSSAYVGLIVLSKAGIIGNKDQGIEVDFSAVNTSTIIETVSATGKIQPDRSKLIFDGIGRNYRIASQRRPNREKKELLVKINPDLYTSSLNRTIAGLSGSKSRFNASRCAI
jgi:HlyD family secretion protein